MSQDLMTNYVHFIPFQRYTYYAPLEREHLGLNRFIDKIVLIARSTQIRHLKFITCTSIFFLRSRGMLYKGGDIYLFIARELFSKEKTNSA